MLSKNFSAVIQGTQAVPVEIEVDSRNGLPGQTIVGLPDASVKESKERVLSAIKNSGFEIPINKYLTINLAPADLRKVGTLYDLPIAVGILQSTNQCQAVPGSTYLLAGELGLDGTLKPITGALLLSILAKEKNVDYVLLPAANAAEAALMDGVNIIALKTLREAVDILCGLQNPEAYQKKSSKSKTMAQGDFSEVKGQAFAKRALEIAAVGGHNLLMMGPPGCGKSMLAGRFPTILPELTDEEAIQVIKLYSIAGKIREKLKDIHQVPYRSPHHTASYAALIGGTALARPGEISLAHEGVLYLDELPEFNRQVLEALRQPMEEGVVHVSRAHLSYCYPASFMLLASANPCPCGFATHPKISCTCTPIRRRQYVQKFSGPLLDRFDMLVELLPVEEKDIFSKQQSEPSQAIKLRVTKAREIQRKRNGSLSSRMNVLDIDRFCQLDQASRELFSKAINSFQMSTRSVHKTLKIARTIADLAEEQTVHKDHLLEALHYRVRLTHEH